MPFETGSALVVWLIHVGIAPVVIITKNSFVLMALLGHMAEWVRIEGLRKEDIRHILL